MHAQYLQGLCNDASQPWTWRCNVSTRACVRSVCVVVCVSISACRAAGVHANCVQTAHAHAHAHAMVKERRERREDRGAEKRVNGRETTDLLLSLPFPLPRAHAQMIKHTRLKDATERHHLRAHSKNQTSPSAHAIFPVLPAPPAACRVLPPSSQRPLLVPA